MKLPFRKSKEFLTALYDILGFYPHNIEIYRVAFSHKSLSYSDDKMMKQRRARGMRNRPEGTSRPLNNERLEFLGDAVLETVVSDILFHHFDRKREGFLTSTRSKIVQRESLNRLATDMGLERLIQAAQGTHMFHTNIGGNAFEALMGAIYLDRGFKFCQWFIANRVIGRYVELDTVAQKEVNFKSKLLEWSQKNRIHINFRDIMRKEEGKGFSTVVTIEGIVLGRGEGRSKKDSQQQASKEALAKMRRDNKLYDSIFRAKEKRTAMEAEESFALPRIEELEEGAGRSSSRRRGAVSTEAPVLESRKAAGSRGASDDAYDAAYDEDADYEVIDTPPATPRRTAADYAAKGIPAPPDENDYGEDDELPAPSRSPRRTARTVEKAVKGFEKGETVEQKKAAAKAARQAASPEESPAKAGKRTARMAEKKEKPAGRPAKPVRTPVKEEAEQAVVEETAAPRSARPRRPKKAASPVSEEKAVAGSGGDLSADRQAPAAVVPVPVAEETAPKESEKAEEAGNAGGETRETAAAPAEKETQAENAREERETAAPAVPAAAPEGEVAEKASFSPAPARKAAPRSGHRHISLDDFVAGKEPSEAENEPDEAAAEEAAEAPSADAPAPDGGNGEKAPARKPRRPRRRPAKSGGAKETSPSGEPTPQGGE